MNKTNLVEEKSSEKTDLKAQNVSFNEYLSSVSDENSDSVIRLDDNSIKEVSNPVSKECLKKK